jgi:type III restriction enzyme
MFTLKNFQREAVNRLLLATRKLLANPNSKVCVFKSPTGSGKTIMMAEFLRRFGECTGVDGII